MSTSNIRIFIGTSPEQIRADTALVKSINQNSTGPVSIHIMSKASSRFWDSGPTGFTMFRFTIPELCDFDGYAIYLDCDMLVLGDIQELFAMRQPGKWVQYPGDDGDCVSVIDCSAVKQLNWPSIVQLKSLRKWDVRPLLNPIKVESIPEQWNSRDKLEPDTKLLHFTNLKTQPWQPDLNAEYDPHPDKAAVKLWQQYA